MASLLYEQLSECIYPLDEAIAGAAIAYSSNIIGMFADQLPVLFSENNVIDGNILTYFLLFSCLFGFVLILFFYTEENKRDNENQLRESSQASSFRNSLGDRSPILNRSIRFEDEASRLNVTINEMTTTGAMTTSTPSRSIIRRRRTSEIEAERSAQRGSQPEDSPDKQNHSQSSSTVAFTQEIQNLTNSITFASMRDRRRSLPNLSKIINKNSSPRNEEENLENQQLLGQNLESNLVASHETLELSDDTRSEIIFSSRNETDEDIISD